MVAKKRTSGRVTPKDTRPRPTNARAVTKARGATPSTRSAEPSSRYTPPTPKARYRPRWHRFAGWVGVALGVAVAVSNDAMLIVEDATLLPFGHQELYLVLALMIAGSSTWFLGVFDRDPTIYL